MIHIDLADPTLFGNDAGEDETPEVLASYFVEKPTFTSFYSPNVKLGIARARKGYGKSALLSRAAYLISKSRDTAIVISVKGSDLTSLGEFSSQDPAILVNQWQQVICTRINIEIGRRLHVALNDMTMTLVESAELSGLKGRNIIGALLERFKLKLPAVAGLPPVEVQKLQQVNPLFLLQNYSKYKLDSPDAVQVWLFVDDIDSTFIDTPAMRLKIATFFDACRKLVTDVNGLNVRASVRTDVWTEIRRIDESLDKCEQYVLDITWTNEEAKTILIKKIHSYIVRNFPNDARSFVLDPSKHHLAVLMNVFPQTLPWGQRRVPSDKPIHILSAGRPRWSGQLCRLAGQEAVRQKQDKITMQSINAILPAFGRFRLDDLYREHSHQFVDLQSLIECFSSGATRYTTDELRSKIRERYMVRGVNNGDIPRVYGYPVQDELELCRFLYKIGFIFGRLEDDNSALSFVRYEDRSDLLANPINLDDGLLWEIHPSYRSALAIRNPASSPKRLRSNKRRTEH